MKVKQAFKNKDLIYHLQILAERANNRYTLAESEIELTRRVLNAVIQIHKKS